MIVIVTDCADDAASSRAAPDIIPVLFIVNSCLIPVFSHVPVMENLTVITLRMTKATFMPDDK